MLEQVQTFQDNQQPSVAVLALDTVLRRQDALEKAAEHKRELERAAEVKREQEIRESEARQAAEQTSESRVLEEFSNSQGQESTSPDTYQGNGHAAGGEINLGSSVDINA